MIYLLCALAASACLMLYNVYTVAVDARDGLKRLVALMVEQQRVLVEIQSDTAATRTNTDSLYTPYPDEAPPTG